MENNEKTERLRNELKEAMQPIIDRLDRIEAELKEWKNKEKQ